MGAAPAHGLISGQAEAGRQGVPAVLAAADTRPAGRSHRRRRTRRCMRAADPAVRWACCKCMQVDQPTSVLTRARTLRAGAGPLAGAERVMRSWIVHACGCVLMWTSKVQIMYCTDLSVALHVVLSRLTSMISKSDSWIIPWLLVTEF